MQKCPRQAVQCDLCELEIHINCNKLNYVDYRYLQNYNGPWYCIEFLLAIIFTFNSFSSNKNFLACCTNTNSNITQWKGLENDHESLLLLTSSNLELLVNQFNNATSENGNNPEKIASSKYYDIDEMNNIETPHKNKPRSLFHIKACFLNKKLIPWVVLNLFWHNNSKWNKNHKKPIVIK